MHNFQANLIPRFNEFTRARRVELFKRARCNFTLWDLRVSRVESGSRISAGRKRLPRDFLADQNAISCTRRRTLTQLTLPKPRAVAMIFGRNRGVAASGAARRR